MRICLSGSLSVRLGGGVSLLLLGVAAQYGCVARGETALGENGYHSVCLCRSHLWHCVNVFSTPHHSGCTLSSIAGLETRSCGFALRQILHSHAIYSGN